MKNSPFNKYDLNRFIRLLLNPNVSYESKRNWSVNDNVFNETGLIKFDSLIPKELCDQAIIEYEQFQELLTRSNIKNCDNRGRNYRVNNLHSYSDSLLKIGTNKELHHAATKFFNRRSGVYTSLTYKHGSQQAAHIDTPFFWTTPFNYFVGVWVALEDVTIDAGPLFYYPGSHLLFNSREELFDLFKFSNGKLDKFFENIKLEVEKKIKKEFAIINKGDVVMWHPGMLHGGQFAEVQKLTRYSAVFHFTADGINPRTEKRFLEKVYNFPTFGWSETQGQLVARKNLPKLMIHKELEGNWAE